MTCSRFSNGMGVIDAVSEVIDETDAHAYPGFRRAAAHRNLDIQVWTVNDYETMVELIELGVDGLMTDYPGRAVRAVREVAEADPRD